MREPDLRDERWFGFPRFFYVPLVKERVIAKPVRGSPGIFSYADEQECRSERGTVGARRPE